MTHIHALLLPSAPFPSLGGGLPISNTTSASGAGGNGLAAPPATCDDIGGDPKNLAATPCCPAPAPSLGETRRLPTLLLLLPPSPPPLLPTTTAVGG